MLRRLMKAFKALETYQKHRASAQPGCKNAISIAKKYASIAMLLPQ
jgi:hypothetical protein